MTNNFRRHNRYSAKLTPGKVLEIRERYAQGYTTQGTLAREYHISIVQIGRIIRNEVWQDLAPTPATERELLDSAERMMAEQVAAVRERNREGDKLLEELKADGTPKDPLDEPA